MLQKIIHFIKYHNAFTIGLALIFIVGASAFANEGVRDAVIGEKIVKEQGIDNSQLLAANLSSFNFGLQITNIQEDAENYYIIYSYQTWVVTNNTWQPGNKEKKIIVSKIGLGNNDLGLYLAEELGEVAESEIKYLKEVQEIEEKNGLQQKIVSVDYTGLMGLALDIRTKVFPNYKPVIVKEEPTQTQTENIPAPVPPPATITQQSTQVIDKETIRQIVAELLAQQSGSNQAGQTSSGSSEIFNITVSEISENFAKITWTTNKNSSSTVEYGLSSDPPYDLSIIGDTQTNGSTYLHIVNLTGLESDIVYHFRVISIDKNGIKAESQDMTFKTLPFQQIIQPQPEPLQPSDEGEGQAEPEPEPLLPEPTLTSESEPIVTP